MPTDGMNIYLSFDDGPEPSVTPFVLDELKKYQAKASFFCIGENVKANPEIYKRIIDEGHRTGNHTQHHLNGWQTKDETYLSDISEASKYISSNLFRPPYGRLRSSQARKISHAMGVPASIVMWDVLSGDFDDAFSAERSIKIVTEMSAPGSIVVFHDSKKAEPRLRIILPVILDFFSKRGYSFRSL